MITYERHQYILQRLADEGSLQVAGLAQQLGVTPMTVWRDLQALEERGLLRRVRGGALSADSREEPEFQKKEQQALSEKRRIAAHAAAQFVKPGDTIILEGGTTVAEMINYLKPDRLALMTNSLPILSRANARGKLWHLHSSGGVLSPISGNFVGPEAIRFFAGKHAQTFFMGATGLDAEAGTLTDPNPVEIEVKRVMADCAKRIVLLLDSSKIGMRSMLEVIPLKRVNVLVTDRRIKAQDMRKLKAAGIEVEVC